MDTLRWYPSRVDRWLAVALAIAPLWSITIGIVVLLAGAEEGFWLALGAAALILAMLGAVMISPDDRDAFLSELASRAGLRRQGQMLVRG
jgi:hypothetical protein